MTDFIAFLIKYQSRGKFMSECFFIKGGPLILTKILPIPSPDPNHPT